MVQPTALHFRPTAHFLTRRTQAERSLLLRPTAASISARWPGDALGFQSQPSIADPTAQRRFHPNKKPGWPLGGETLESFPPGTPLLTLCSPSPPTAIGVTVPGDDDDRHRGMSLQLLFPSPFFSFPRAGADPCEEVARWSSLSPVARPPLW